MRKSIKLLPFPEIPRAMVVISTEQVDEKVAPNCNIPIFSFLVQVSADAAVEWEPKYGAITLILRCSEQEENAMPHWYFPFHVAGLWSQLTVNELELGKLFANGEYQLLFDAMQQWGCNNIEGMKQ